jgi:hypothetical protein
MLHYSSSLGSTAERVLLFQLSDNAERFPSYFKNDSARSASPGSGVPIPSIDPESNRKVLTRHIHLKLPEYENDRIWYIFKNESEIVFEVDFLNKKKQEAKVAEANRDRSEDRIPTRCHLGD